MSLTLHTTAGAFRAFKALIAAEYAGVAVTVNEVSAADAASPAMLAKNPTGRLPFLETPQGTITQSNAIARYIGRMRRDVELYGVSFFESAQVDSWMDFASHNIELPATVLYYPVVGYMPENEMASNKARDDLAAALAVLEAHLVTRTYLVGHKMSLADICVASALVYPFKLVLGADFRAAFPCVNRWFDTCVHQPAFTAVVGEVSLCEAGAAAAPAAGATGGKKNKQKGKKGKKNKGGNAPAPAAAAPAPAPAAAPQQKKKPKHPLRILDEESPSPMSMDTVKKIYSNCGSDYNGAVDQILADFDANGYSLWLQTYNYNAENTKMFMVANAISGFLQRTDEIRRWAFGVVVGAGEEPGPIEVSGVWIFRGDSAQHMLDANPDAEYHTWTQLDVNNPDDLATFRKYLTCDAELDGKPVGDCKVFK